MFQRTDLTPGELRGLLVGMGHAVRRFQRERVVVLTRSVVANTPLQRYCIDADSAAVATPRMFSEDIASRAKRNLFRALTRTGADMKQVLRVNNLIALFEATFEPRGNDNVTVTLGPSNTDCTAKDAFCTDDGSPLTGTIHATINGP